MGFGMMFWYRVLCGILNNVCVVFDAKPCVAFFGFCRGFSCNV